MAEASVGPYRILERLGAGANGEVLLAEDTRLHRRVALKKLFDRDGSDPAESRRRLLREARAAARLNHPNIAAVHDVLETDEAVHIVMEYAPGPTLAARVRQGPLAPMQVLDVALQLSGALAHAHGLGVVHRDLKPANVVISPDGRAKILDFGLARLHEATLGSVGLSSSEGSTDGRQVVGTPPYIPPEHLRGAAVDARGDVYSLGVTLFELLTGRRPFEAQAGLPLADAILSAPTPRPRSVSPQVPQDLDDVVYRAMAREPEKRYGSAAELESDLKRLAAGITDAPTVSWRWPLVLAPRQRRLGWTALAGLAVALAVYGAVRAPGRQGSVATVSSSTASGPHVIAVLPLAGAVGDPQTESLAAGVADGLITTLSKVPGLSVVSRAATLKYQDRKQDPDDIARELGATMLVDGGLQRSGERLRVTLTILQPGSKAVAWQGAYDGTFAEVFTLQREVADAVAGALRLTRTTAGVDPPPTASVEAFADYAQAQTFLERPDVKDNLDRSIQLFQSAITRDRRFARAHAGLGGAYWRKYQTTREDHWSVAARDAINEALRLDPTDVSVRLSLASVYRGMGRKDEAAEELRRVVALQPQSDEAHRQLGLLLVETGSLEQGAAEIREAIRLRPTYWGHHYTLGTVLYDAGQYQQAVPSFRRATELQPDNAWGYNMLGATYHAMNASEEAIPHYQRAIALGHGNASANLGSVYLSTGRLEDAERSYQEALKRDPDSPLMHHNLGDAQARMGRASEARKHFRTGIKLATEQLRVMPRDARTMSLRAVLEAKLGLHAEAGRHVGQAVSLAPDDSDVRYDEAVVRTLGGHLDDGTAALAAAVEHGHSAARAAADPNLAPLRHYPPAARILSLGKK